MPDFSQQIGEIGGAPGEALEQGLERGVKISDMLDRQKLVHLQRGEEERQIKQGRQVEDILSKSDYSDPQKAAETAAKINRVSPKAAMDFMKTTQAYQSGEIQRQIDLLTLGEKRQSLMIPELDQIISQARQIKNDSGSDINANAYIQKELPGALQRLRGMTLADGKPALPDDMLKMVSQTKPTLAALEGWEGSLKDGHQRVQQRLEQFKADIQARHAGDHVETIMVGGKPHKILFDAEGKQKKDLGLTTEPASAQGAAAMGTDQNKQLLAALAERNVSLPAGLRSTKQIASTLDGLWERARKENPNATADDIADKVQRGVYALTAGKAEATVTARREANIASAQTALIQPGGVYDQLMGAAKKLDFGNAVTMNAIRVGLAQHVYSSPEIQAYVTKLEEARAELSTVFARTGQATEGTRRQAAEALPETASYDALNAAVEASKEVGNAVIEGNETVLDAITKQRPLSEVLKSLRSKTSGVTPYSDPDKERRYQEWKRTHPNG